MSFWNTIKSVFAGSGGAGRTPAGDPDGLMLYVKCNNCGENVAVRLNRRNDLVREDSGGSGVLFVRKQIMDNKCFRLMEAEVWYDGNYTIVTADVQGGVLLTADQYEAERALKAAGSVS